MSVGLLELAPSVNTLERVTGEALFHRSPKQWCEHLHVLDPAAVHICHIARNHRTDGAPPLAALIHAAEYRSVRPRLTVPLIASCISADPELVTDWLVFSANKRTTGGWAFEAERRWPLGRRRWKVWEPFPEGEAPEPRWYDSAESACADYILTELDFWTAVGDERKARKT